MSITKKIGRSNSNSVFEYNGGYANVKLMSFKNSCSSPMERRSSKTDDRSSVLDDRKMHRRWTDDRRDRLKTTINQRYADSTMIVSNTAVLRGIPDPFPEPYSVPGVPDWSQIEYIFFMTRAGL